VIQVGEPVGAGSCHCHGGDTESYVGFVL
jgi:hypothetical protein